MKLIFATLALSTSLLYADAAALTETSAFEPNPTQKLLAENALALPSPQYQPPARKSPFLAATLSSLIPGLGHVYLGDMQTAGGLMGSTYLGVGLAFSPEVSDDTRTFSLLTAQNIYFYGVYAAYRDARLYNGSSGYAYKMPTDSLASLSYAPFKPSILKKPEVWGGILGALALASCVSRIAYPKDACIKTSLSSRGSFMPVLALPVGVGEESFFRGFMQSALSESFTPWGGIALSSLAFAAVHIPNAEALEPEHRWRYYSFSLPLITVLGGYFGWLTYKNTSLQESVAVHTWYDLVIFTSAMMASEAAITGNTSFAISLPF